MQDDLLNENPSTIIDILGINSADAGSGNALMVAEKDLPWLQDTVAELVWVAWNATIDDVLILDENNRLIEVLPLLRQSLADQAVYDELKAKLKAAAGE